MAEYVRVGWKPDDSGRGNPPGAAGRCGSAPFHQDGAAFWLRVLRVRRKNGRVADVRIGGHRVALLKPETYMNESGRSISAATRFYKTPTDGVLVVHDDVDLEFGRFQAREGGGLAGHNGLRSIAQSLGDPGFLRLRVGVGRPDRGDPRDVADFVLSPFDLHEDPETVVTRAADAVESLVNEGLEETQRRFNEH